LPLQVREDLLKAALPPALGLPEAELLFGQRGGVRARELAEGPYFLGQDESGDYRFHSLFREFLLRRWAEEKGHQSLEGEQARLANWYLQRDQVVPAYDLACAAKDWKTAETAITPFLRALGNAGEGVLLQEV